jgi:hypothetical protein
MVRTINIHTDLLLESAFKRIVNVMQLILIKIKWQIKWKYLISKFLDIRLSYYFKYLQIINKITLKLFVLYETTGFKSIYTQTSSIEKKFHCLFNRTVIYN